MQTMYRRLLLDDQSDAGLPAPAEKPAAAAPPAPAADKSAAPPAADKPAAPPPEPEPSDDPFAAPKKPAPKPGEKPAAAAAPVDFDKLAPKELRERVKALNQEKVSLAGRISEFESKIKEMEARGADTSALTTRLTALEKERDAAQAELRAARQEASPEFKEKWDKPFNLAATRAQKQISELTITDAETGTTRPAKWDDFRELYGLPVGKALERAKELFGEASTFVMSLREKLLDMDNARTQALEEERQQFKERSAKETAELATRRQKVGSLWNDTNKRLAETNPNYKVDPTDTEAVEARNHALSVFDADVDQSDPEQFIQKKVLKDAHIRQQVAAYGVQKILLKRKDDEIARLKAQVDELKGASPGGTQRSGGEEQPAGNKSWEQELIETVGKSV